MPSETLILDPTSEDATNTQLSLEDNANGIRVITQEYPTPERAQQFTSSADMVGDRLVQSRYRNRMVTITVRCFGTEAVMRARVNELEEKVGKLSQFGGTLKRTLNNSDYHVFDVLDADLEVPADWAFLHQNSVTCTLTLTCEPFAREPEVWWTGTTWSTTSGDAQTQAETTLPELVFTVTNVPGDVPGKGRLEVIEADNDDQTFVHWGIQAYTYPGTATATTTAALAYEAEARLPLNGATALAVAGASGGTVVNQGTLTPTFAGILSLASSGTVYPTHVGDYAVWARLYPASNNAGTVSVALEWAQGDFRRVTRNPTLALDVNWDGSFVHVPLGHVHLTKPVQGANRWEGRIIAKSSTLGDDLAVDRVYLFPVTEGYGEIRGVLDRSTPTSFLARDEFDQSTSASLATLVLPVGGTWTVAGDADRIGVSSGSASRAVGSDAALTSGAFALAGLSAPTNVTVQALISGGISTTNLHQGLVARYTDTSNYLICYICLHSGVLKVAVDTMIAGVNTNLTRVPIGMEPDELVLRFTVTASGRWTALVGTTYDNILVLATGSHSALATGGALASGLVGLHDANTNATTPSRKWYEFQAWTPVGDAAVFAGQSLTVRHNRADREDSTGTYWTAPSDYRGDYLRPPALNAGTALRVIVKASRNDPDIGTDSAIDDLSAKFAVTPLRLHIAE